MVANLLYAAVVVAAVTYLSHIASVWTWPLIHGGLAGLLFLCILLAAKAIRNLPPSGDRITTDNIEQKVRHWLDRSNLTVQRAPQAETHFRFLISTDGGKKVVLGRLKNDWSDYLNFRADLGPTEDEIKTLASLSEDQKTDALLALKLELARAQVGYSGLVSLDSGFAIFKRLPISHSMSEDEFIDVIWELEAVLNRIHLIGAIAVQKNTRKEGTDAPK